MSTDTTPTPAADNPDGWYRDWNNTTSPETTTDNPGRSTENGQPDNATDGYEPPHEELLISEACRLLDGTEEMVDVNAMRRHFKADPDAVPVNYVRFARTDDEATARVRLAGVHAQIATASATDAQASVLAVLSVDVADGFTRLADVGDRQAAALAEIARHSEASRREASDRTAALIDAEYADSTSRAGFWALVALVVAVWAGIGGPRPDWSWVPQDALPYWLPATTAFIAVALASIGALITLTRYAEARYRWSARH